MEDQRSETVTATSATTVEPVAAAAKAQFTPPRAAPTAPLDLGNMFWSVLLNRLRSLFGLKPKTRCPTCGK
jgi:hypothetical protein